MGRTRHSLVWVVFTLLVDRLRCDSANQTSSQDPPQLNVGRAGGFSWEPVSEETLKIAVSVIGELAKVPDIIGDHDQVVLLKLAEVHRQIVAGTNFRLKVLLRTEANPDPSRAGEPGYSRPNSVKECQLQVYRPLPHACDQADGCATLSDPGSIRCSLLSEGPTPSGAFSNQGITVDNLKVAVTTSRLLANLPQLKEDCGEHILVNLLEIQSQEHRNKKTDTAGRLHRLKLQLKTGSPLDEYGNRNRCPAEPSLKECHGVVVFEPRSCGELDGCVELSDPHNLITCEPIPSLASVLYIPSPASGSSALLGGFHGEQINEESLKVAAEAMNHLERLPVVIDMPYPHGCRVEMLRLLQVDTQLVAGTNFRMKLLLRVPTKSGQICTDKIVKECSDVVVFRPLPQACPQGSSPDECIEISGPEAITCTSYSLPDVVVGGSFNPGLNQENVKVAANTAKLLAKHPQVSPACDQILLVNLLEAEHQVVAGMNYRLKLHVKTGSGSGCPPVATVHECRDVSVFKPLPHTCDKEDGCISLSDPDAINCKILA